MILAFPEVCFAMNVHFSTSFEENVDTEKIRSIVLLTSDVNEDEIEVALEKTNHYAYTLQNMKEGRFTVDSLVVEDDYIGVYSLDYTSKYENNDLYIDVLVKNTPQKENTTRPVVTDEEWARIIGSTNKTSKTTTRTTKFLQTTNETTTTKDVEKETKQEETKTRNRIYIFIFSILGVVLVIVLLRAFIKIMNANK